AKCEHEQNASDRKQTVDLWNIDLPLGMICRVFDRHARQIAKQHRLPSERERTGDEGLRRDHRGGTGEQNQQVGENPSRYQSVEGVFDDSLTWITEDYCPLSEVSQYERWEDEKRPCQANGLDSKVPHVSIQGLAACHGQDDRAEDEQAVDTTV